MRLFTDWLVRYFLFAGTMFAAGDVALGGGDGGAADGEASAGDGAGPGDAAISPGAEGASEENLDGTGAEGESQRADAQADGPRTHRAVLESFSKSEEFKALAPEVQKSITRLQQSLRTISEALAPVGGLKQAQEIAKALESAGGLEAISAMQSRLAEIDDIDAKLAAGDPAYVDNIAENMPEEFAAMMPHAIDKWAATNQDAFLQMVAANVVPNLFSDDPESPGIANLASRAFDLLAQGKTEDAQKILKTIYGWCKDVRAQASKKVEAKAKVDPARAGNKDDAAQKELANFDRITNLQIESYSAPKMESEIRRQFGNRTVEKDTMDDMLLAVTNEMTNRAKNDNEFIRQVTQARQQKNEKRLVELGRAFADKNIAEAAKVVYGRRYRGMNFGQRPAAKNGSANGNQNAKAAVTQGVTSIVKRPADTELILKSENLNEFQRKIMSSRGFKTIQQAIMSNIGFTKSGKVVNWQKD